MRNLSDTHIHMANKLQIDQTDMVRILDRIALFNLQEVEELLSSLNPVVLKKATKHLH